ncbi:MAG: amidohydrolase [Saprospiraceae bacterium]|nr:amidohydrolase [Saprospiraceae bacterium]
MQKLTVTLVQKDLIWEDVAANLQHLDDLLSRQPISTDVLFLPEMFTTGFSMDPQKTAEPMDGSAVQWMKKQAQVLDAAVCGSLIIEENGQYYNRLIWMRPDGTFDTYDKRHLFTLANEHQHYQQGDKRLVTTWRGWKICPLICYDLRFPVWSRNTVDFDLLVYVANWPKTRITHWKNLIRARAVENQCYGIALNRIGIDGSKLEYSGHSTIVDFNGTALYEAMQVEDVFTLSLDKEKLDHYKERFQFLQDRDSFEIQ